MSDHNHSHDHLPTGHGHPTVAEETQHLEHEEHGVGKYIMVFIALCVLTACSVFTYSPYWPFGKHVAWAFMFAISCTKAMLVIMFFMHSLWEANWKWVLTIPASFMSIFLMLMLVPDIGWRQNNGYARYSEERLLYAPDPPIVEKSELKAAEEQLDEAATH